MIKAGQIYKITRHRFGHINNIIAITRISDRRVDAIRTDGTAYKNGVKIEGAVCSGFIYKGTTIRFH